MRTIRETRGLFVVLISACLLAVTAGLPGTRADKPTHLKADVIEAREVVCTSPGSPYKVTMVATPVSAGIYVIDRDTKRRVNVQVDKDGPRVETVAAAARRPLVGPDGTGTVTVKVGPCPVCGKPDCDCGCRSGKPCACARAGAR